VSWALRTQNTQPTRTSSSSAIQPRSRVPAVGEVGDDPRHQRLEPVVPAVFAGVERPVAVQHPAEVARAQVPEDQGTGRRGGEAAPDRPHRRDQLLALGVGQRPEQPGDLGRRAGVQLGEPLAPELGQPERAPPADLERPAPEREPGGLEPGQDPGQVGRVELELGPQRGDLDLRGPRELEQHPGLGQGERAVDQVRLEQAEQAGVETVERPHLGDRIGHGGPS
jgi:hypothetical protein